MNRLSATFDQLRRSSPNDLFASLRSGCAKLHSIEQSRTRTFFAGFTCVGGLRVYWYARVSIRKSGCSFAMMAAMALIPVMSDAECAPPLASSIALHFSQVHGPCQSF